MPVQREILGRGWKFPFRIGGDSLSHDGPEQSKFEQHVVECIRHRILTKKGERRFSRGFGTRLFELPFEIITHSPGLARRFIRDGLEDEPRIVTLGTSVRVLPDKNRIDIAADIQFIETSTKANLVFPFYNTDEGRPTLTEVQITLT